MKRTGKVLAVFCLVMVFAVAAVAQTADPLPSWNEGKSKQEIIKFVKDVTTTGSAHFVPVAESRGWIVVDMKRDWKVIYPAPK